MNVVLSGREMLKLEKIKLFILKEYFAYCKWVILVFHLMWISQSFAQDLNYFNIVPFIGGINNQSQALIVLPDSNEFYIVGELIDSINMEGQFTIRPFLSRFDYEGNLIATFIISDSLNIEKYHINTRPILKDSASILVLMDRENSHFGYDPCLLKLDLETGRILQCKIFGYAPTIDSSHVGEWYSKDYENNIVSAHYLLSEKRIFIKRIGKDFNILNEFLVEDNGRWNAPKFIEYESDSTYVVVGTSIAPPGGPFPESKIFYMRVNENGTILDFKVGPNLDYNTIIFTTAKSYTVLRDSQGNWFISVGILNINSVNPLIYSIVPISISLSNDFTTTRWVNYFSTIPIDTFQYYILTASAWSKNKSGFVISGYDYSVSNRNSFITKIDTNGNTVWTRNFIPLGWDKDDFAWADLQDIKLTPHNSYVASGMIYDNNNNIRQPWIIHIDSMGCLLPGCDVLNSTDIHREGYNKIFLIYPNPTKDQLYLIFREDFRSNQTIHLIDNSGRIIKSTFVNPILNGQYILSLSEIPAGTYFIEVVDENSNFVQIEKIIKL